MLHGARLAEGPAGKLSMRLKLRNAAEAGERLAIPILRREQVDELVGPMASPLNMNMAVEELRLEITGEDLTLRLKFGFKHRRLEGQAE